MKIVRKTREARPEPAAIPSSPDATAVLAALTVGFCLIDENDAIIHANAVLEAITGLSTHSLQGQPIHHVIEDEDVAAFSDALNAIRYGTTGASHCDIRLKKATAPSRWFRASLLEMTDMISQTVVLQLQPIDDFKQTISKLEKSETRWKYALESAHQGVWDHDFKSGELFYSIPWRAMRGMEPDAPINGSLDVWIESVHPADREYVLECIRRQDEGEAQFNTFAYRERHADGHWVWIESRGASIEWDADGKPSRIIGTDTDITDRKKAEAQLEEISRRLRLALNVSKIGVFEANLDTGAVVRDTQLAQIYGMDSAELDQDGSFFAKILHPDDRQAALDTIDRGIASKASFANAFRIVRPNGEVRHIQSSSVNFVDANGENKLVGANWDVTDDVVLRDELERARQLAEARNQELEAARISIEYNALHDHLTRLPNRRFLDQRLEDWIVGTASYSAILHIDLDRFKQINDTLGHAAGDAMLRHTANVLSGVIEDSDFVARIGGDEFLILCNASHTQDSVIAMTDRIIEILRQPVPYNGHLCRFGASVGIAWTLDGSEDAKQSLMNADIALYRAKGLGRNRYEFFTKQLQTQIHHAKRTADEIIRGLEDGEFIPFYQPQFDARTLDIVGVETLVRWVHPQHGLLAPDYFLKIAEDINALTDIDGRIAEQALKDFGQWEREKLSIPRISVNVSSPRLREPGLIDSLKALDIPRDKLSFELLESIFLDDLDAESSQILSDIKSLGIDLEIDDFGTGHASIVGLMKLNPRRLKIDRALVKPIVEAPEQRRLVASIIDIGHSLDIEVIAEGVETRQHADILRDLGCDTLQGYALARPMRESEIRSFIQTQQWRTAQDGVPAPLKNAARKRAAGL